MFCGLEKVGVVRTPYGTFVWYPTIKIYIFFWDRQNGVGIHFFLGRIEYMLINIDGVRQVSIPLVNIRNDKLNKRYDRFEKPHCFGISIELLRRQFALTRDMFDRPNAQSQK